MENKITIDWLKDYGFTLKKYERPEETDYHGTTRGYTEIAEKTVGSGASRKHIRIDHNYSSTVLRNRKKYSNWYQVSAVGNGFTISSTLKYRKFTQTDIINILNVIGLNDTLGTY